MTESSYKQALDEATYVRVKTICGIQYLQAWYGGTQVRVFVDSGAVGSLAEVTVWSVSDDRGRPVDRETIEEHMEMHFGLVEESAEEEGI